jgi:hypothetical protein
LVAWSVALLFYACLIVTTPQEAEAISGLSGASSCGEFFLCLGVKIGAVETSCFTSISITVVIIIIIIVNKITIEIISLYNDYILCFSLLYL